MSIALKPKTEPNENISPIFNLNNFYRANDYASKSDLLSYANLYTANFFQYLNTFTVGLNFAGTINGISDEIFSYIVYIPNIIFELTNFSYDEVNNSTNITGNTFFETTSINTNCNIGSSLNVTNILNHNLTSDIISCNTLNCRNLSINGQNNNETVGFLYVNGISLPIQKSNLISNFNIQSITTFYFTIKQGYRLDLVDVNDQIRYSYTNTTSDYKYYQQIPYNLNMIKINIYDSRYILL